MLASLLAVARMRVRVGHGQLVLSLHVLARMHRGTKFKLRRRQALIEVIEVSVLHQQPAAAE